MRDKPHMTKYEIMQPKYCVHCQTFTQAKRFMKWARDHGVVKWWNDHDTPYNNKWDVYMDKSCYQFVLGDRIALTTYDACVKHKYNIVEYNDYKWV